MLCASELTPDSYIYKTMLEISTKMATVNQIKLYFDTCDSQIFTQLTEDFVTLNEDHTTRTLRGIASDITIQFTGIVK